MAGGWDASEPGVEGTMVVVPGLSRPLEVVGKRVVSWGDGDGGLIAGMSGFVQRGELPEVRM